MPANPPPAQLLPVVQVDRELAEFIVAQTRGYGVKLPNDADTRVQAVAKFRVAHSPERGELASMVEALEDIQRRIAGWPDRDKTPPNGGTSAQWEPFYEANRARRELQDRLPEILHALSASPGGEAK